MLAVAPLRLIRKRLRLTDSTRLGRAAATFSAETGVRPGGNATKRLRTALTHAPQTVNASIVQPPTSDSCSSVDAASRCATNTGTAVAIPRTRPGLNVAAGRP